MMKRLFTLTISLLITLVCSAVQVEIDGLWYEVIEKAKMAEVIQYQVGGYSGDIVIPEKVTYNGMEYPVTSIGEDAFFGCSLTSIIIPNSVTSIGREAFYYCSSLTSITIPNSVTSIGSGAFDECYSLKAVHITDIAAWCKIEFGSDYSNPLDYAHHLYLNGEEVKDLVIPNSVTSIGKDAFSGCSSLTSITIPNSVTSIGNYAFYECI